MSSKGIWWIALLGIKDFVKLSKHEQITNG